MQDLEHRLEAFRKEGSELFVELSAADNSVRIFADAKRENSADDYDTARVNEAAVATLEASINQSVEVYNMFARANKEQ